MDSREERRRTRASRSASLPSGTASGNTTSHLEENETGIEAQGNNDTQGNDDNGRDNTRENDDLEDNNMEEKNDLEQKSEEEMGMVDDEQERRIMKLEETIRILMEANKPTNRQEAWEQERVPRDAWWQGNVKKTLEYVPVSESTPQVESEVHQKDLYKYTTGLVELNSDMKNYHTWNMLLLQTLERIGIAFEDIQDLVDGRKRPDKKLDQQILFMILNTVKKGAITTELKQIVSERSISRSLKALNAIRVHYYLNITDWKRDLLEKKRNLQFTKGTLVAFFNYYKELLARLKEYGIMYHEQIQIEDLRVILRDHKFFKQVEIAIVREGEITLAKFMEIAQSIFIAFHPSGTIRPKIVAPAVEDNGKVDCKYCGYKHIKGRCSAYGNSCHGCGKKNHFKRVCRNKGKEEQNSIAAAIEGCEIVEETEELAAAIEMECNTCTGTHHMEKCLAPIVEYADDETYYDSDEIPALVTDSESESDSDYDSDNDMDEGVCNIAQSNTGNYDQESDSDYETDGGVCMVAQSHTRDYDQDYFLVDTGASSHHLKDPRQFEELKCMKPTNTCIGVGGGAVVKNGEGTAYIEPLDITVKANYNKNLKTRCGVLSAGRLIQQGWDISFKKNHCTMSKNGKIVKLWKRFNTFYIGNEGCLYAAIEDTIQPQDTIRWHQVLGCASASVLKKIDPKLSIDNITCDICPMAKGRKKLKGQEELPLWKLKSLKELKELTLYVDFKVLKDQYILIFCYRGYIEAIHMEEKNTDQVTSETLKLISRLDYDEKLKYLITDLDSPFRSKQFETEVSSRGLQVVYAPPGHHSLNVAERYIQSYMNIRRSLLAQTDKELVAKYPVRFNKHCALTHNARPQVDEGISPWETITKQKFPYKYLHKFGSTAYIPMMDENNTDEPKKIPAVFIGLKDTVFWNAEFISKKSGRINVRSIRDASQWSDLEGNVFLLQADKISDKKVTWKEPVHEVIEEKDIEDVTSEETYVCVPAIEHEAVDEWLSDAYKKGILINEEVTPDEATENLYDIADRVDFINKVPVLTGETKFAEPKIELAHEVEKKETLAALVEATDIHKAYQLLRTSKTTRKRFCKAIKTELKKLISMGTLQLINVNDIPEGEDVIGSQLILDVKRCGKHRGRCVARGDQMESLPLQDTYSSTVTSCVINILTCIAAARDWIIATADVTGAYLNGKLKKPVFMRAPYPVKLPKGNVFKVVTNLYGLKNGGKTWMDELIATLKDIGLKQSTLDQSLFIGQDVYIGVHVDDLYIIGTNNGINNFLKSLKEYYDITEEYLSEENSIDYLGMDVVKEPTGYKLTFKSYITSMVEKFKKFGVCVGSGNSPVTPCPPGATLEPSDNPVNISDFRSALGTLGYMRGLRPDISFTLQQLSGVAHAPGQDAWDWIKRVTRYLNGTKDMGLMYKFGASLTLTGTSDASWANCLLTRRSIGGHVLQLGGAPVLFTSKRQSIVCDSSTYSEFVQLNMMVKDLIFIHNLLEELEVEYIGKPVPLFTDNTAAEYLCVKNSSGRKSRHFDVTFAFVRQYIGTLAEIGRVMTDDNCADIFTKGLSKLKFVKFRDMLMQ